MSAKIDDTTMSILQEGIIDSEQCSFTIPRQLEREEYEKVNNVLVRLRGKWNTGAQAHIFPFDPSGPIYDVITTGNMPEKNPTAFFPTPISSVELMYQMVDFDMIEFASEDRPVRILEPSAGVGGIADFLRAKTPHMVLETVEILPANQLLLKSKGYDPFCGDFMDFPIPEDENKFDYIFMNPPFSLVGDSYAYMTHIKHALKMLQPAGELVAIVPTGWTHTDNKKAEEFRNLVASQGRHIETLEKGTFKESGTMIETKVITFYSRPWKDKPYNGYPTYNGWEFALYATQNAEQQRDYEKLITKQNVTDEDYKHFVNKLIKHYAQEDVFISTTHTAEYIAYLKDRSIEQKEMMVDWVESMYEELHSWRFTPLKLSYVKKYVGSYARQVSGLVKAMKEYRIDIKDVRPLLGTDCENAEAFITKQKQIIASGGGLLELMSA